MKTVKYKYTRKQIADILDFYTEDAKASSKIAEAIRCLLAKEESKLPKPFFDSKLPPVKKLTDEERKEAIKKLRDCADKWNELSKPVEECKHIFSHSMDGGYVCEECGRHSDSQFFKSKPVELPEPIGFDVLERLIPSNQKDSQIKDSGTDRMIFYLWQKQCEIISFLTKGR